MTHLLKYVQPNESLVYSEYITLELLSISFADVWRCSTWHGRSESHEFHPCMIYLAAMRQAKRRQHLPLWRTRTSASRTDRHKQRAIRYVTSHGQSRDCSGLGCGRWQTSCPIASDPLRFALCCDRSDMSPPAALLLSDLTAYPRII